MAQKRILVVTAETGHTSISNAVAESLSSDYTVSVHSLSGLEFAFYYPVYLYFPQLSKLPFALSQTKRARQVIHAILAQKFKSTVSKLIKTEQPDLVISCWSLPNPALEKVCTAKHIPFINILADPRTFHATVPSEEALNCVFDATAAERARKVGIPKSHLLTTGWFTQMRYYQPYDQTKVRSQLQTPDVPLVILVAAGSAGTNAILKILPTFVNTTKPLCVYFACGSNHELYSLINNAASLKQKVSPNNHTHLIPLKFTQNLERYIQAADVIVGKAGPNLLFETIAAHKPFFAITHIAGQEDGNLEIIQEYQLGFVEEQTSKANQLLKKLITHPELLNTFKPSIQRLAESNQHASTILKTTVAKLLATKE
jgi:UDP-N-acetylglucosamine:LPS N-acetylglucosamine transferase